jgi:hypothetical protein
MRVQLHVPAALARGKSPLYALNSHRAAWKTWSENSCLCRNSYSDPHYLPASSHPLYRPRYRSFVDGTVRFWNVSTWGCSYTIDIFRSLFLDCLPFLGPLCGLVVRVPGYSPRGPGFDSRPYQIFWIVVSLERGPLSFVSINEELLERKSSGSGLENWD